MVYSYLIEHDLGLAPNPFGKYCTLAVCKPKIRKSKKLQIGDWVVGTGAKGLEEMTGRILVDKLIYAMQVSERVSLEHYWDDPRFRYKRPVMNGPLVAMYGDNFYHKDNRGDWIQEDSAHSNLNGTVNAKHLRTDTSGKNVLISEHFYYFGDNARLLPTDLLDICHTGIGEKKLVKGKGDELITWIESNFKPGLWGDPLNWNQYNQFRLF